MSGLEVYTAKVNVKYKEQGVSPFGFLTKAAPHLPSQKKHHSVFLTPPQAESSNQY